MIFPFVSGAQDMLPQREKRDRRRDATLVQLPLYPPATTFDTVDRAPLSGVGA
jgi:hypothetical protein